MKHGNKKLIMLVLGATLSVGAAAQSAVTAAGGTAEGGGYVLSYSVGQVASAATADGQLREGTMQPVMVEEMSVDDVAIVGPAVTVYPNPTVAIVKLSRDGAGQKTLDVQLYDQSGRLLRTDRWEGSDMSLDLGALPAGIYIMKVDNRTFKITKQ